MWVRVLFDPRGLECLLPFCSPRHVCIPVLGVDNCTVRTLFDGAGVNHSIYPLNLEKSSRFLPLRNSPICRQNIPLNVCFIYRC
jgi:hypothetical protein